jgi:23S rRNA G2445 N2-methylase RlmL
MLYLVETWPGARMLDPFCGAGTIPIEAALNGSHAVAVDYDPAALTATTSNAHIADINLGVIKADARQLPFATGEVDFTVTNLPWGRQIQIDEQLAGLYRHACAEIERVTAAYGHIVLLTSQPIWFPSNILSYSRRYPSACSASSLRSWFSLINFKIHVFL